MEDAKAYGATVVIIRSNIIIGQFHYEWNDIINDIMKLSNTKENFCGLLMSWLKTEMIVLPFLSYTHQLSIIKSNIYLFKILGF
jgi:hypothetical protein